MTLLLKNEIPELNVLFETEQKYFPTEVLTHKQSILFSKNYASF